MTPNSQYDRGKKSSAESTRIVYGVDVIVNAILQILNQTNKIHVCVDRTRPSLMTEIAVLKEAFVAAKRRSRHQQTGLLSVYLDKYSRYF